MENLEFAKHLLPTGFFTSAAKRFKVHRTTVKMVFDGKVHKPKIRRYIVNTIKERLTLDIKSQILAAETANDRPAVRDLQAELTRIENLWSDKATTE